MNEDTARILSIPMKKPFPDDMPELLSQEYLTPWALKRGCRLLKTQAQGLVEYLLHGHAFCDIKAGQGKTLLSLLIAHIAYKERGMRKILLIIPPALGVQTETVSVPMYREWANLAYPVHWVIGRDAAKRKETAISGRYGLYVMSYSQLSGKDAEFLLQAIAPELVILDEAHMLSRKGTARTTRFWKYLAKRQSPPKAVAMSGSFTQKSLRDFAGMANYVLGPGTFLPTAFPTLEAWAKIIDADTSYQGDEYISPYDSCGLDKIFTWAKCHCASEMENRKPMTVAGYRIASSLRMRNTPGVVVSDGASACSAQIIIRNIEAAPTDGHDKLLKIDEDLEKYYLTPSGEQKSCAMEVWGTRWLLSTGIYSEQYWPTAEELIGVRKDITSKRQAEDYLRRSQNHFMAWNEYKSALRRFLKDHHIQALDTPHLIGMHLRNHTKENGNKSLFDSGLPELWHRAKDMEFDGIVDRMTKTIRVCDFKIRQCVEFCREHIQRERRGLLVFYYHEEVGEWAEELMREAGLPVVHCKSNEAGSRHLADKKGMRDKIALAAIGSHYQGKDLQYYDTIFYLEWYRTSTRAEQSLARCHRTGQESDIVTAITNHTSEFDYKGMSSTLTNSLYVQQTTQIEPLKVLQAHYDPKPRIFPDAVIEEIGIRVPPIGKEVLELYRNKFDIMT